ncbi:MAG: hypothetical protein QXZ68_07720 [Candidatus Bathyarchaeia archaeon]
MSNVEENAKSGPAGATSETSQQDVRGKILEYFWHLQKLGRKEATIQGYVKILNTLAKKVDILNPEAVLEYLSKAPVTKPQNMTMQKP